MSNDSMMQPMLASPPGTVMARVEPELTREQIDLLKRTIARGTTDDEFKLFLEACRRRRFDPFSRLIYPVKRWDSASRSEVMALQSSIDSFRLVAERTGRYAGQLGPFWCGRNGEWVDVWLGSEAPAASRVGVLRADFKEPLWGVALWSNYVQKKKDGSVTQFWDRMGPLMLAKCAESVALRRAFPEDLAGLYTSDEMEQAQNEAPTRGLAQVAQDAAARAPAKEAPRAVEAHVVHGRVEPSGKGAVEAEHAEIARSAKPQASGEPFPPEEKDDPRPADAQGDIPAFTEPVGPDVYGCYKLSFPAIEVFDLPVPRDTFDYPAKWERYKITSKNAYINGKAYGWMPGGAPKGGREGWLVTVVRAAAERQMKGETLEPFHERAITCLYLMLKRRAEEATSAQAQADWDEATKDIEVDEHSTI
jgi:phage recombination protein Bet